MARHAVERPAQTTRWSGQRWDLDRVWYELARAPIVGGGKWRGDGKQSTKQCGGYHWDSKGGKAANSRATD